MQLKHFSLLACVFLLTGTAVAAVEPASYLNYKPAAREFPAPLDAPAAAVSKGSFEQALQQLSRLQDKTPRGLLDELYFLRGLSLEGLGKINDALQAYEDSLKLRSANPLVQFRRGRALQASGDCKSALEAFQEVRWISTRLEYEVLYAESECYSAQKNSAAAIAALEAARNLNPSYAPVLKSLIQLRLPELTSTKRNAVIERQAITDLETLLKRDPNDRQAKLILAELLVKRSGAILEKSDVARAESLAREAVEQSAWADDDAVRVLASVYMRRGDLNGAEETVKRGLSRKRASRSLLEMQKQIQIQREGAAAHPLID